MVLTDKNIEKIKGRPKYREEIDKNEDFKQMELSKRISKYCEMNNILLFKQNLTEQMEAGKEKLDKE